VVSTPDDLTATLSEAQRIADGLQFACRIPDKTPDFTSCGGPAAEAYWAYFAPSRLSAFLRALDAVLKLTGEARGVHWGGLYLGWDLDPAEVREAITEALAGKEPGNER